MLNAILRRVLSDNTSLVNDVNIAIPLLGRTYYPKLQVSVVPWAEQFQQNTLSLPTVFAGTVAHELLLYLSKDIRESLNPFELLSNDGAPTGTEKKALNEICGEMLDNKTPYVIYKFNPNTHSFVQGSSNTWDDDACAEALRALPHIFDIDAVDPVLLELPISFNFLKAMVTNETTPSPTASPRVIPAVVGPAGTRRQPGSPTQGIAAAMVDLTLQSSFDQSLMSSEIFKTMASNIALLVSAQQAVAAPSIAASQPAYLPNQNSARGSVNPFTGRPTGAGASFSYSSDNASFPAPSAQQTPAAFAGFGQTDFNTIFQTEQARNRNDAVINTRGMFESNELYTNLYGHSATPNVTAAIETVKIMFHGVFRSVVPKDAVIKPFLLMLFQNSLFHDANAMHLYSLAILPNANFTSDAMFFHCRVTLSTYAGVIYGPTLAEAVARLFDHMYIYMLQFPSLSWGFIEDYLCQRLNRLRRLRLAHIWEEDFHLADVLLSYFLIDESDLIFWLQTHATAKARRSCSCTDAHIPPPAAAEAAARFQGGRNLKSPRSQQLPRPSNLDWPKAPSPPDTQLCSVPKHPCYFWVHGNADHPCPNLAGGVSCPHPHVWPGSMTTANVKVKNFIAWVKRDKLL